MDFGPKKGPRGPRRREKRKDLTTFCSASFDYQGKKHRAILQNISQHGAGFRLEVSTQEPDLRVGDEVTFEISTPYGLTTCVGRIVWTNKVGAFFIWGIEFVRIPVNPEDPMHRLIESSF
jgi:hypothetical protein